MKNYDLNNRFNQMIKFYYNQLIFCALNSFIFLKVLGDLQGLRSFVRRDLEGFAKQFKD